MVLFRMNRYKSQLLYGCDDPNCLTPTCFSYRKRVADAPIRRFTELSARTIACYLASQDNPERGLCRNGPVTSLDLSEREDGKYFSRRPHTSHRGSGPVDDVDHTRNCESVNSRHREQPRNTGTRSKEFDLEERQQDGSTDNTILGSSDTGIREAGRDRGDEQTNDRSIPRMKDPKSFTQNLFDTLSLRMVEWLPLRKSAETVTFGPSEKDPNAETKSPGIERSSKRHPSPPKRRPHQLRSGTLDEHPKHKSSSIVSSGSNAPPTAVEVKLPGQTVKRLSLEAPDQWKQSIRTGSEEKLRSDRDRKPTRKRSINNTTFNTEPRRISSPPALKARSQKHRHLSTEINDSDRLKANERRRVSWDASKLSESPQGIGNCERFSPVESSPRPQSSQKRRSHMSTDRKGSYDTSVRNIQTLSHLSEEIITGLEDMMFTSHEDAKKWQDEMEEFEAAGYSSSWNWQYATLRQRQVFPFVSQSIFYVLSQPDCLLRSFRSTEQLPDNEPSPLNALELEESFRVLHRICPWEITLHSLWVTLEKLLVPPDDILPSARQQMRSARSSFSSTSQSRRPSLHNGKVNSEGYVSDADAAEISVIALFALISSISCSNPKAWKVLRQIRSSGAVLPDSEIRRHRVSEARLIIGMADRFEHDLALRLLHRLVRAVSARQAFHEISKSRVSNTRDKSNFMHLVIAYLKQSQGNNRRKSRLSTDYLFDDRTVNSSMIALEWLRCLLLKEWDGNPEISKSEAAGGVVQLLSYMYKYRNGLGLLPEDFHTSSFSDRLDPIDMPVEWVNTTSNNRTIHLLSYPFLFPPNALVTYFRSLNYTAMSKSYEAAVTSSRHMTQTAFSSTIPVHDDVRLLTKLKTSIATFLVLVVRREAVLTDAFDQLWRRERRELMRPLKVKMGMDEGEEGVDHGGVQQEFFRLAISEALDPSYGMFTMDIRSRISWFQPCSPEPLYKFELLGLLVSLAVYNGLTLPVNFPIALYRKLLGLRAKSLDHIKEGWSELSKGLDELLSWEDGDVGYIFMRTYEFSFDVFGNITTVDMEKVGRDEPWPFSERSVSWGDSRRNSSCERYKSPGKTGVSSDSENGSILREGRDGSRISGILKRSGSGSGTKAPRAPAPPSPPEEAALVTNENREQFVEDYIFWLTDKSIRPQYEAFARGFYTCLDRAALSIFTPESLKTVIEGIQTINVNELQQHARYEGGFEPDDEIIEDFWKILRRYPQRKLSQLLEFVTASDRVPVNGISSIMFVIQKNGTDDTVSC